MGFAFGDAYTQLDGHPPIAPDACALSTLEALDFLYMPSRDVERDIRFYADALGAEVVFAIEAFGARVARVSLTPEEPRLLLADHLAGEAAVLVFRVVALEAAISELRRRGAEIGARFDIPHGPCTEIRTPGGQRPALYEQTRPQADQRLAGRIDFGLYRNREAEEQP